MACQNCNKAKSEAPQGEAPALLTYTTTSLRVTGRDGLSRRIDGPLVDRSNIGARGYKVVIPLRGGHSQEVDGATPQEVMAEVKRLLQANSMPVTDHDIWFNLNIQWSANAVQKRQQVTPVELLKLAEGNPAPEAGHRGKKGVAPAAWGRKGWGMLQMYLALDNYEAGKFLMLATELASWVNPDVNPSTGCAKCYKHFMIALADLQQRPRYTQLEARQWLVATMNKVNASKAAEGIPGARQWSYEEAAKANYWS